MTLYLSMLYRNYIFVELLYRYRLAFLYVNLITDLMSVLAICFFVIMQALMIQHRCMLFTFIMGIPDPSSETIPKPKNTLSATNEKAGQDVEKRHRDPARIRAWVL